MMNILLGSVASSFIIPAASGGGLITLPAGVPIPKVWYSPDTVTEVSGTVTLIPNLGTAGATYDLVPRSANQLRVVTEATWGSKKVFDTTVHSSGGYEITGGGSLPNTRTFMAMATYNAGASTFGNFDAIVSGLNTGSSSGEFEMVGNSGQPRFFGKVNIVYIDGTALSTPTTNFLPLLKETLTGVQTSTGSAFGTMFYDNFGTSRYWNGLTGEIMIWDEELTATQIANLHTNMAAYYA